jgi:uncharacterized protein (TIGR02677 family)
MSPPLAIIVLIGAEDQRVTRQDRSRVFAHLLADKAALYRAILEVFVQSKQRFLLHLRPSDVATAIDLSKFSSIEEGGLEVALGQLVEWRNIDAHPDTADVSSVEEFYRARFLYQLTPEGEAVERALQVFDEVLRKPGELQTAALGDIRVLLEELLALATHENVDGGKVHRTLSALCNRFDELTSRAQAFLGSLQRTIDLHGIEVADFITYKQTLIDYLERFIGELVIAQADISNVLSRVEQSGTEVLLNLAAQRDLTDAVITSAEQLTQTAHMWRDRWSGLRAWFVSSASGQPQADILRARARSAIPALLSAVAGINERRVTRSDRSVDLRVLARWFAQTRSEREAHQLWRAAFALSPSRHLLIDAQTVAARDAQPVPPQTSWLDAPPLLVTARLRATGSYVRRGRPNTVIDRSEAKKKLAEIAATEAAQIDSAQRSLADRSRIRLSDIGRLEHHEFELFLDLLGEALSRKLHPAESVEAASTDGTLTIKLDPTEDALTATIETPSGLFTGPDHWVVIRPSFTNGTARPSDKDVID